MRYVCIFLNFLLTVAFLSFYSCGKKWKKPTEVSALFQLKNSGSGLVNISSGSVVIEEIDFDGMRKQGENHVSFQKKFDGGTTIPLSLPATNSGITFDIPQGTYTGIDLRIKIKDFNNNPSLTLTGSYINSTGVAISVIFDLYAGENIDIHAASSGGGTEIVLVEDNPSNVVFALNPLYWFQLISQNMLENADLTNVSGTMTMFINKDDNEDIYDIIADRIRDGNEALFY